MHLKRISASTVILFIIGCLAGCTKSSAPLNSANVMFVNGCVSASSVSVKANSASVDGASGIPFLGYSGYQPVTAGSGVNLTFFLSSGVAFANRAVNIAAPNHYSAFVGGDIANPTYVFTTDDLTPPSKGNAKLRFVNLSPDNISETITANDSIVAQGFGPDSVSAFYLLRAGKYALGMFDPRNDSISTTTDSLVFTSGKIYTVMLTGTQLGSGATGLVLTTTKNN